MIENGRAVAPGQRIVAGEVVGPEPESDYYTIWVSGLCSPWVSWGDSALAWLRAARSHDQETIRGVINLRFGELFRVKGEAPPWEDIKKISADSLYDFNVVPKGVRMIFVTVDVQKTHLVCIVRGWGVEMESWLIKREELWGETDQMEVWGRLDAFVDQEFEGRKVDAIAVDSGYRTEQAYTFCEKRMGQAYATGGKDRPAKLYQANDVEVLRNGKKVKRGLKRWSFDHGYFKGWVHARIKFPQDQPGAWHLPRMIDDDYCKQLTNETLMRLASGRNQWVKTGTNDWLDAEALQVLLAHIMNVRYLKPETGTPPPAAPSRGVRNRGVEI
jgi:phage terminase large subunit GpA-like protein